METLVVIVLLVAAGVGIRLWMGTLDRDRITRYVRERGGQAGSIEWNPLGKGWFGEKSDRIYEVSYRDADGNRRSATCKTGLFTGVYFTDDIVVERAARPAHAEGPATVDVASLLDENERLRAEVERLQRGAAGDRGEPDGQ